MRPRRSSISPRANISFTPPGVPDDAGFRDSSTSTDRWEMAARAGSPFSPGESILNRFRILISEYKPFIFNWFSTLILTLHFSGGPCGKLSFPIETNFKPALSAPQGSSLSCTGRVPGPDRPGLRPRAILPVFPKGVATRVCRLLSAAGRSC